METSNTIVKESRGAEIVLHNGAEPNPSALLQLAVQQNLDIDKLEKLMQLQERWQAQQARKEFLNAISQFQASCPTLEKTKKVEFTNKAGYKTKYSYASLGDIVESIKKPLSDQGLSFRWEIQDSDNKLTVTCLISHLLGHSERTTMSAAKDESGGKNEIQQRGSSITYLQRYTLIAALGISTADEDIDGHKDDTTTQPAQPKDKPAPDLQPGDGKKAEGPKTITNQGNKPWLNPNTKEWDNAFAKMHSGQINMDDVLANYRISKVNQANLLNPKYVYEPTNYEKFQPGTK